MQKINYLAQQCNLSKYHILSSSVLSHLCGPVQEKGYGTNVNANLNINILWQYFKTFIEPDNPQFMHNNFYNIVGLLMSNLGHGTSVPWSPYL
jgi:hypothetical protein